MSSQSVGKQGKIESYTFMCIASTLLPFPKLSVGVTATYSRPESEQALPFGAYRLFIKFIEDSTTYRLLNLFDLGMKLMYALLI